MINSIYHFSSKIFFCCDEILPKKNRVTIEFVLAESGGYVIDKSVCRIWIIKILLILNNRPCQSSASEVLSLFSQISHSSLGELHLDHTNKESVVRVISIDSCSFWNLFLVVNEEYKVLGIVWHTIDNISVQQETNKNL